MSATGALLGATPGVDIAAAVKEYDAELAPIWAKYDAELAPIWAKRDAELAPIRAKYDAELAPIRAKYDAELAPIWAKRDAELAPIWAKYDAEIAPIRAKRDAEIAPIRAKYNAELAAIWAKLLHAVQANPLAAWIVEYAMPSYESEALTVLRSLPATMDQLDAIADENSWCKEWAEQVSAARFAGVLPAVAE
jgi:hypothetical protein